MDINSRGKHWTETTLVTQTFSHCPSQYKESHAPKKQYDTKSNEWNWFLEEVNVDGFSPLKLILKYLKVDPNMLYIKFTGQADNFYFNVNSNF